MSGNRFIVAWRDFDNDRQEVSYEVKDTATVANFTTFGVAVDAWLCGSGAGGGFYDNQSVDNETPSSNPIAQSKSQAIMALKDSVNGRTYKKRLPFPNTGKAADGSANPAFISSENLTIFNPAHADYAALKTAVETYLESPLGNAVTLDKVYIEE